MGTESIWAVAIPVTRLVAPGPEVPKQTPHLSGGPGIGISGVGSPLLVAHQDVPQPSPFLGLVQLVVHGEDGPSWDSRTRG